MKTMQSCTAMKATETLFPLFYVPAVDPPFEEYMYVRKTVSQEPVEKMVTEVVIPRAAPSVRNVVKPVEKPVEKMVTEVVVPRAAPSVRNDKASDRLFPVRYVSLLALVAEPTCRITSINEEMAERQKIALHFASQSRANRVSLKRAGQPHKVYEADVDEICSDLMTAEVADRRNTEDKRDSCFGRINANLGVCLAYAVYYKAAIYVVQPARKTFVAFSSNEISEISEAEEKVFVRFDPVKSRFYRCDPITDFAAWVQLDSFKRALKPLGHYKVDELAAMYFTCTGREIDAKMKKQEIYDAVNIHCCNV